MAMPRKSRKVRTMERDQRSSTFTFLMNKTTLDGNAKTGSRKRCVERGWTLIDFENFNTGGNLLTPLSNPVTFGDVTFTSLTGSGPYIFDMSLSGGWSQSLTQVSSKTFFAGGEPHSAIAIEFSNPVSEILLG